MISTYYLDEPGNLHSLVDELLSTDPINIGEWQSLDISTAKLHATHELTDVAVCINQIPRSRTLLQQLVHPDLPWAEEHFEERVSGIPHNPPPSHEVWPYAVRGNGDHLSADLMFDHTYPERFWPKYVGSYWSRFNLTAEGIRFKYGDLSDVVNLLVRSPLTRQAYLPVWFPEDTGAVQMQRVPCTLGYHFMIRDGRLSTRYYIRSCDAYRHFNNDVYLAARLTQWIVHQLNSRWDTEGVPEHHPLINELIPGSLIMYISSFHVMVGDVAKLKERTFHVPS